MKNKMGDMRNLPYVVGPCDEISCPCNEGKGCQADMSFLNICDKNSFRAGGSEFNKLMNEAYWAMLEVRDGDGDSSAYDEVCARLYDLADRG